jgi:GNAT superfamily N-acetyltransferase
MAERSANEESVRAARRRIWAQERVGVQVTVRPAVSEDIAAMVGLSEQFRRRLAAFSPVFWRMAPDAQEKQGRWFRFLLTQADTFALVHAADSAGSIGGFLVARMTAAPPVYAPGAPICLIDDFCVEPAEAWPDVGGALLGAAIAEGQRRGAPLTAIVAAHLDAPKRAFLVSRGFAVTSEWHVRENG